MNTIFNKLLSGRFIITIIAGIVYLILSVKGILPVDRIMEITLLVFYGYFTKNRDVPKEPKV